MPFPLGLRPLAAPDQPHIRDREGVGEAHRGQDGGQPARQPRRPHPGRADEEDMMGRTLASASALPLPLRMADG